MRYLGSRSAVAERELLYTVRPEERALDFIARERTSRSEEIARIRADLEIREEELEFLQNEHRVLKATGNPGEAQAWLQRNQNQVVRLIRVVASLREELTSVSGSQEKMNLAEQKLRALVDYKKSEARRYDREQANLSFSEIGGIGPDLVPEVFGGATQEGMSPEVAKMFDELFGASFDLPSFRTDVARSIGWSFGAR